MSNAVQRGGKKPAPIDPAFALEREVLT